MHTNGAPMDLNAEQASVLSRLVDQVAQQAGTVLLTHDVLNGSEALCRELLRRLPESSRVGWVLHTRLTLLDFVRAVCHAFRVHGTPKEESSLETMQEKLLASLKESQSAGKSVVLVISDAHLAPFFSLNHLSRLNTDAATGAPLFYLVLLGESGLLKQLEQPELAPTRNAVVAQYPLNELAPTEPMPLDNGWLESPLMPSSRPVDLFPHDVPMDSPPPPPPPPPAARTPPVPPVAMSAVAAKSRLRPQPTPKPPNRMGPFLRVPWRWAASAAAVVLALLVWWAWPGPVEPETLEQQPLPAANMPLSDTLAPKDAPATTQRESVGTVTQAPADEVSGEAPAVGLPVVAVAPAAAVASAAQTGATAPETPGSAVPRLADLVDDQAMTWPLLGRLWGINMRVGDEACDEALRQGVQCFRSNALDFDQVRAIDRPAMLLLHQDGVDKWVRLLAIDATHARLASSGREWILALPELERMWKSGALATLWRLPPGQTRRVFNAGPSDPAGQWLNGQLKALQAAGQLGASADNYTARVTTFQTANDLRSDGRATPTTFVLVNRLSGVDEPNLRGPVR